MPNPANHQVAGLAILGVSMVPQVMSVFLPSPAEAYTGSGDPGKLRWLRRGELLGASVCLGVSVAVALLTYDSYGNRAWLIPAATISMLIPFMWEYERAMNAGQAERTPPLEPGYA